MARRGGHRLVVDRSLIERDDVAALRFAVHEIDATLLHIEELLLEDGGEAEEAE